MRLPGGPRCNGAGNLHNLGLARTITGPGTLRRYMTILLIIVVWFAVAYFVGCRLGGFIHDTQNDRGEEHSGTYDRENHDSESNIKHTHQTKEINHDSRKARIEHGERTH
jgi:hypothetical protein